MAAQDGITTLRHLLTQQKPRIHCNMTAKRNTSNGNWPDLIVTIWDDFNLTNLNESYGHILDSAVPESQLVPPQPTQALASVAINKAEDINHMLGWNDRLMQQTLQLAKTQLGLYPGTVLQYQCSTADKLTLAKLLNGDKRLVVDHVIALDDVTVQNLVVGLGRPSSKWSGRKLANHIPNGTMELCWPIRQLANICKIAETRYGYIQTNEELVVCCFSRNGEEWKAAIMPIPWTKHGDEVLTTDLAVWWLCMLAMSGPHHRAIVAEGDMVDIGDWDFVHLDEERGWVRRHRYSNFEVPTDPPPPPAYRTLSPGNLAASAAAVGLYADEPFDLEVGVDSIAPNTSDLFNFENLIDFNTAHHEQDFNTTSERGGE